MFNRKNVVTALVLGTTAWVGALGSGVLAKGVDLQNESKIWFNGDSTLHPYSASSENFKLNATVSGDKSLTDLEVVVPVKSLKSGDGLLDGNMYRTMGADKFPTIQFNLNNAKTHVSDGVVEVKAEGHLTIAGVEKTMAIEAEGKLNGDSFRVKGSKELMMSDFGIKPPTLMLGTIKVKDRIVVHYDLVGKLD